MRSFLKVVAPALQGLSNKSVSKPVPEAVSETVSEGVSEAVPEAVPEAVSVAVSEGVPEAVPEAVSEGVSEAVSEAVSETVSETVPETVSEGVPETVSEAVSVTVSKAVSDSIKLDDEGKKRKKIGAPVKPSKRLATSLIPQKELSVKRTVPLGPSLPQTSGAATSVIKTAAPSKDLKEGLEGGDLNWCPPVDQTGDGKTHLNAKFGY